MQLKHTVMEQQVIKFKYITEVTSSTVSPSHTPRSPHGKWGLIRINDASAVYAWPNTLGGFTAELYQGNITRPLYRTTFQKETELLKWAHQKGKELLPAPTKPATAFDETEYGHPESKEEWPDTTMALAHRAGIRCYRTVHGSFIFLCEDMSRPSQPRYIMCHFRGNKFILRPTYWMTEPERHHRVQQIITTEANNAAQDILKAAEGRARQAEIMATVKPGTILTCSYGYSMTLVDFYEVTGKKGTTQLVVKKLGKTGDGMQGHTSAIPGTAYGEPIKALVTKAGYIKIEGQFASVWDGRPKFYSHLD